MPKMLEISQQIRFGFDVSKIDSIIAEHDDVIKKWVWILHDKDVYESDGKTSDGLEYKKGDRKEPHVHVFVSFGSSNVPFDRVAKWFGVPVQCVSKIKGRFVDAVKYATHRNAENKFQYAIDECHSNFDIENYVEQEDAKKAAKANVENLCLQIVNEEILASQFNERIDGLLYVQNKNRIDAAFQYVAEKYVSKIMNEEIRKCNLEQLVDHGLLNRYKSKFDNAFKNLNEKRRHAGGDRTMECIFMTGDSGTGKTSYAKKLAKEKGMTFFVSSGSNDPFDGYTDEECIILDDLRGSVIGLSDLLKILDNNTATSVPSRYYNKWLACKMIIITSTQGIDEFFRNVFSDAPETIVQLKRRCQTMMMFHKMTIDMFVYDAISRDYIKTAIMPNPIFYEFQSTQMKTDEDRFAFLSNLLGSLGSGLTQLSETIESHPELLKQQKQEQPKLDDLRVDA